MTLESRERANSLKVGEADQQFKAVLFRVIHDPPENNIPLQQPPEEEHNIKYYLINAYMAVKTFTLV